MGKGVGFHPGRSGGGLLRKTQAARRSLASGLARPVDSASDEELNLAVRRATRIAHHAELGDDTYDRFDQIADEWSLARTKAYGTVEKRRSNLAAELAA